MELTRTIAELKKAIEQKDKDIEAAQREMVRAVSNNQMPSSDVWSLKKQKANLEDDLLGLLAQQEPSPEVIKNNQLLKKLTNDIRKGYGSDTMISLGDGKLVSLGTVFEKFKNIINQQREIVFPLVNVSITFNRKEGSNIEMSYRGKNNPYGFTLIGPVNATNVKDFFSSATVTYVLTEQSPGEWLGQQIEEEHYTADDIVKGIFGSYAKLFPEFLQ